MSTFLSRSKLLMVDDEPGLLKICAHVLRLSGFSVVTADGPLKALAMMMGKAAEKTDVGVAILDYNMPTMNGCALAEELRSMRPDLKIILHSGAFDIPPGELASVDVFVPKGGGVEPLIAEVARLAKSGPMTQPAPNDDSSWATILYNSER